MAQPTNFFYELRVAGRGVLALLIGDRRAGDYFNATPHGLVGSFIAALASVGLNGLVADVIGGGGIAGSVVAALTLSGLQILFLAIVLRQLGRSNGFIGYLVADNWAMFYFTLLTIALTLLTPPSDLTIFALGIAIILTEVNIARLIVGLSPLQVAMLLVAQLAAVVGGLMLIFMVQALFGITLIKLPLPA